MLKKMVLVLNSLERKEIEKVKEDSNKFIVFPVGSIKRAEYNKTDVSFTNSVDDLEILDIRGQNYVPAISNDICQIDDKYVAFIFSKKKSKHEAYIYSKNKCLIEVSEDISKEKFKNAKLITNLYVVPDFFCLK